MRMHKRFIGKVPLALCMRRKAVADILNKVKKNRWLSNPDNRRKAVAWSATPKQRLLQAEWRKANKSYFRHYQRNYRLDPINRLVACLRTRISIALKGNRKCASLFAVTGCTVDQLRAHLEAQFKPGMSWDNYGQWHVDHKRPCASFDLSQESQQRECFHYTNLQPLWAKENLTKSKR